MDGRPLPRIDLSFKIDSIYKNQPLVLHNLRELAVRSDLIYSRHVTTSGDKTVFRAEKSSIGTRLMELLRDLEGVTESQIHEVARLVNHIGNNYNRLAAYQHHLRGNKRTQYFHHYAARIPPRLIPLLAKELLKPKHKPKLKRTMNQFDDRVLCSKQTRSEISSQPKPKFLSLENLRKLAERSEVIYSRCAIEKLETPQLRKHKNLIGTRLMELLTDIEIASESQIHEIAQLVTCIGNNYNRITELQNLTCKENRTYYFYRFADRIPSRIISLMPEELMKPNETERETTISPFDDGVLSPVETQPDPKITLSENDSMVSTEPTIDFFDDSYFCMSGAARPAGCSEPFSFGKNPEPVQKDESKGIQ